MTALRIDHLNRAFGSLVVTDDVSLDIVAGERHVIIGPNGAGKTSLVNQIGGQLAPSSGRILVAGQDITGRSPDRISRMGVAHRFQRQPLWLSEPDGCLGVVEFCSDEASISERRAGLGHQSPAATRVLSLAAIGGRWNCGWRHQQLAGPVSGSARGRFNLLRNGFRLRAGLP